MSAQPDTIIFTGGGTESVNLAILGIASAGATHGKHIITLAIEHHSALLPLQAQQKEGFELSYVPINKEGIAHVEDIIKLIRPDTIFVPYHWADKQSINRLTQRALDPISRIPEFKMSAVRIKKIYK